MSKFTWEQQRDGLLVDLAASLAREDALRAQVDALRADAEARSLLLGDMASALEYHQEQTRPIHSTKVALDAYRAARGTGGKA